MIYRGGRYREKTKGSHEKSPGGIRAHGKRRLAENRDQLQVKKGLLGREKSSLKVLLVTKTGNYCGKVPVKVFRGLPTKRRKEKQKVTRNFLRKDASPKEQREGWRT